MKHIKPSIYECERPSALLKARWQDVRRIFFQLMLLLVHMSVGHFPTMGKILRNVRQVA